ncbi:hypothetical protein A9Q84_15035 [Halobacteriovorax marinus]|uniref:HTH cro/C1-type domain-containing protein n=1 Tax=Halobacteriovorax marinus TaxID=97084 RepID=A0A1Y5FAN6_9BACT|nr:hypothetical protein A9Q84_15035 [Halobacteriovorax marinus]
MVDTDSKLLIDTIKLLLKKEGLTYKQIGVELSLSEVSIKRIFSKYDCSLSKITQICKLLSTTLLEVSELARKSVKNKNYFLSDKQETYFSKHPFYFFVFRELYRGRSNSLIQAEYKISDKEMFKILRALEKLELLDIYPDNKVKFKISGQLRLKLEGVFFEKLIKKQNHHFLESVYKNVLKDDCCMQASELQLSKTSLAAMVQDINSLGKKYREKAYLEGSTIAKKDLTDVRWLFAFLPYKTDWESYR